MELSVHLILLSMLAFFVGGCIDSIAGGGGLITTPTLLALGVPAHFTLGSGKFSSMLGSSMALATFWKGGEVLTKIVATGVISSFTGGVLGSLLALAFDNHTMTIIMVCMIPVGMGLFIASGAINVKEGVVKKEWLQTKAAFIGLVVCIYEGVFGPGSGSFFLIVIHVLIKAGLVQSSGTAKAFNIAANLGAVCSFATAGTVSYGLAIPCALASICGNRIGARYAMKVGPSLVRKILFVVIAALLITLILRII
ncbi:MAG: sulfite exporter TauE/SafE family protein [Burkholderiales bacterium]|nr:sulfite exporter TauE/SafE family protein [Burkholderiales bacterium]